MNKVANVKVEVPIGKQMNDQDYLTDLLSTIKNMVSSYALALNEASNDFLYDNFKKLFDTTSKLQRDAFNLMFNKGWYTLEEADYDKVMSTLTKANQNMEQL